MSVLLEALRKAAEEKKRKGVAQQESDFADSSELSQPSESNSESPGLKVKFKPESRDVNSMEDSDEDSKVTSETGSEKTTVSEVSEVPGASQQTSLFSLQLAAKEPTTDHIEELVVEDDSATTEKKFTSNILNSTSLTQADHELDFDIQQAAKLSQSEFDSTESETISLPDFESEKLSQEPQHPSIPPENSQIAESENIEPLPQDLPLPEFESNFEEKSTNLNPVENLTQKDATTNTLSQEELEKSYSWKMNDLPGYQDQGLAAVTESVDANPPLKNEDAEELKNNEVLASGKHQTQAFSAKKKKINFGAKTIVAIGVLGAFALILLYSSFYFQTQAEALENSFNKYKITRVEPSKELLERNKVQEVKKEEVVQLASVNEAVDETVNANTSEQPPTDESQTSALPAGSETVVQPKESGLSKQALPIAGDSKVVQKEARPAQQANVMEKPKTSPNKSEQRSESVNQLVQVKDGDVNVSRQKGLSIEQQRLKTAYIAYKQQDWKQAEKLFAAISQEWPNNINALLGYAGSLANQQKYEAALERYQTVLRQSPNNLFAIEGIAGLMQRLSTTDFEWETTLKKVLKDYPDSAILNSSIGSLYAKEQNWNEAQNYYFKALSIDSTNAQYNFNLAVSLDHLKQYPIAIEYYTKALVYKTDQAFFDEVLVKERLAALKLYQSKGMR